MPVTVQASNQSTLQFSNPGNALVTTSYVTSSSLTDTHLLSPQQPALQRNTVSPGLPQRPASAGERDVVCGLMKTSKPLVCSLFLGQNIATKTYRSESDVCVISGDSQLKTQTFSRRCIQLLIIIELIPRGSSTRSSAQD